MTSLDFVQANSLAAAVAFLNAPGLRCRPIAGGTDLVVALRQRDPWFDCLVDITAVPELLEIEPALVPTAPAICNAIAHATGRRVRDLPANLERVLLGHELARGDGGLSCKSGLHLG